MPDKDNLDSAVEGSNVGGGVSRQCDISVIVGEPENTIRDLEADIAHWRAENERLRAALQHALDTCRDFPPTIARADLERQLIAALERKP